MNFNRLPKVDRYAQNEAESRIALKHHFQEKNGFLRSSDDRDMGSDFLFELISEEGATNWRFPVQIKSIETPDVIQNGQYISLAFPLSTLRYLLEFTPPVAIIVFYLVDDKQLYYDYAENVYFRLMEVNDGSNDWKEQEKAKIHIPIGNILNEESRNRIHRDILEHYRNMPGKSKALYSSLENSNKELTNEKLVTTDPIKDAVEILMREGLQIYYNHDIRYLNKLFNTLPNKIISESPFLSLLAGITFHDMRMLIDADYFLKKALSNKSISEDDHRHARWTKMFNDLEMGKINSQQVKELIDDLTKNTPASEVGTLIQHELCIARNEIESLKSLEKEKLLPFIVQFDNIKVQLEEINHPPGTKLHYCLLNAINLSLLIRKFHSMILRGVSSLEKQGEVVSQDVKDAATSFIVGLTSKLFDTIDDVVNTAYSVGDYIQLSRAYEVYVSFRVMTELTYLEVDLRREGLGGKEHAQQISKDVGCANTAFKYFFEGEYLGSAYNCLLMILELKEIANYYNMEVSSKFEQLEDGIAILQEKLGVGPPRLHSQFFIERNRQQSEKNNM